MKPYFFSFLAMGTPCNLQLFSKSQEWAGLAAALAIAEVERIQRKYSRYLPNSTLSLLNRDAAKSEGSVVDDETAGLIEYAFACHLKSDGFFDVTSGVLRRAWDFSSETLPTNDAVNELLPLIGMEKLRWKPPHLAFTVPGMELDFGGIGKEYAVDRVATILASEGVTNGLIDFGGDLFALGPLLDGQPWKIGLRDPHDKDRLIDTVELMQGALATSGDYERCITFQGKRYSHILNPVTGWPVTGLSSVTVLAPQCMVAGSISTIAMLKGLASIPWLAGSNLSHRWVDGQGNQGGISYLDTVEPLSCGS